MKAVLSSIFARLIQQGELTVEWPDATRSRFAGAPGPQAGLSLRTWRTVRQLTLNPGLALGEAYMDGFLEPHRGGLHDLLDLIMLNVNAGGAHPVQRWHRLARGLTRRLRQVNGAARARRNVAHHYDLDHRLYSRFLDRDLQYSCAYFRRGDETLEEAQAAKKRLIAAKLALDRPGLRVLNRLRLGRPGADPGRRVRRARDRHHAVG